MERARGARPGGGGQRALCLGPWPGRTCPRVAAIRDAGRKCCAPSAEGPPRGHGLGVGVKGGGGGELYGDAAKLVFPRRFLHLHTVGDFEFIFSPMSQGMGEEKV